MTFRIRKLPYYVASYAALRRIVSEGWILLPFRSKPLHLRDGLSFRVSSLLDVLILKETLLDDVYGLREVDARIERIVDVGASFGDFSIVAARRFPNAEIVAFEPDPRAFELLRENVERNGITNVEAVQGAVGTGSVRLGEWLRAGPIGLLKVDCEGAELDVLDSAGDAIRGVRRVVVEYHRRLLRDADRLVEEYLARYGFKVHVTPDAYDADIGYVRATAHRAAAG
jgi:predicted RNA methylase